MKVTEVMYVMRPKSARSSPLVHRHHVHHLHHIRHIAMPLPTYETLGSFYLGREVDPATGDGPARSAAI